MSPEHLQTLKVLSQLFEDGIAGPKDVKKLTELLSQMNQVKEPNGLNLSLDQRSNKFLIT